jgi:hypothetical protein
MGGEHMSDNENREIQSDSNIHFEKSLGQSVRDDGARQLRDAINATLQPASSNPGGGGQQTGNVAGSDAAPAGSGSEGSQ